MKARQIVFAAALAALNLGVVLAFEALRPRMLSYDGLWNARTALWAGLLLVDNLVVVWWYANLTGQAVGAARIQAALSRDALDAAREQARASANQFQLAREADARAQRPCVVIEWQRTPRLEPGIPAGHNYVARNVGAGLALNVVYVEDVDAPALTTHHIGALPAGGAVELPGDLTERLNRETESIGSGICASLSQLAVTSGL